MQSSLTTYSEYNVFLPTTYGQRSARCLLATLASSHVKTLPPQIIKLELKDIVESKLDGNAIINNLKGNNDMEVNDDTSVESQMIIQTVNSLKKRLNIKVCDTNIHYTQIALKKSLIEIGKYITVYHDETSNFQIGTHKLYFHPCTNSNRILAHTPIAYFYR